MTPLIPRRRMKMQTLHLIADNNDEGIRLDAFLAQKSGETRSRIQNLIKDGCVRRNGKAPGKAGATRSN